MVISLLECKVPEVRVFYHPKHSSLSTGIAQRLFVLNSTWVSLGLLETNVGVFSLG